MEDHAPAGAPHIVMMHKRNSEVVTHPMEHDEKVNAELDRN